MARTIARAAPSGGSDIRPVRGAGGPASMGLPTGTLRTDGRADGTSMRRPGRSPASSRPMRCSSSSSSASASSSTRSMPPWASSTRTARIERFITVGITPRAARAIGRSAAGSRAAGRDHPRWPVVAHPGHRRASRELRLPARASADALAARRAGAGEGRPDRGQPVPDRQARRARVQRGRPGAGRDVRAPRRHRHRQRAAARRRSSAWPSSQNASASAATCTTAIIQRIYGVSLSLEDVPDLMTEAPDEAEARVDRAIDTLHDTIRDIRSFIVGLRPSQLADGDLAASVRRAGPGAALEHPPRDRCRPCRRPLPSPDERAAATSSSRSSARRSATSARHAHASTRDAAACER